MGLPTNLDHLRKLCLEYCALCDVYALGRFPFLKECNLSINKDIVLSSIPNLIHLRTLRLESCDLGSISGLSYFPALTELDLRYNRSLNIQRNLGVLRKVRKVSITRGNRVFVLRR